MLSWIDDSSQREEVHKAYFGNYEITIIKFSAGGGWAWIKQIGISPIILKKSYPKATTIEEIKESFMKELYAYLNRQVNYWKTVQYSLWKAELEDDVDD
jgi:hypothetical protein